MARVRSVEAVSRPERSDVMFAVVTPLKAPNTSIYTHDHFLSNLLLPNYTQQDINMVAKESHSLTKIVYKPDSQSTEEYIAVINPEEV